MGAFSIWHWAIVILAFFAFPAIVVATERSGKRANRGSYSLALVVALFVTLAPPFLLTSLEPAMMEVVPGLSMLANIVVSIWFLRTLVKRLRDAAHPKALGYLSCIPLLNLAFFLYMIFPESKADARAIESFS